MRWLLGHRVRPARRSTSTVTPEEAYAWDPVIEALGGAEADLGAGHRARLPRRHLRLARRRGRPAHQRQEHRHVLPDEIAEPLGLDIWIGLPESAEHRTSPLVTMRLGARTCSRRPRIARDLPEEMREMVAAFTDPNSITQRASRCRPKPAMEFNSREMHAAEVPAANGIT